MKSKAITFFVIIITLISISSNILAKMDTDISIGDASESVEMTERILGTLQVCGSVISVIALCIIGLRYMFSTLEEKANMKGVLIYYVVGAVLVFATSNILGIVYNIINGLKI